MLKPYTIVGVFENTLLHSLSDASRPELTLSYQQVPRDSLFYRLLLASATQFVLHTSRNVDLTQSIHRVIREMAPGFAVDDLKSMDTAVEEATGNQRLGVYLIGSFAGLAVLMVVAGLYGVLSQLVNQRQQEVGIRIALGAARESIQTLFLRKSWGLIAAGILTGLVASLLRERNAGESDHSILQAAITAWFWNHQGEWQIEVRPEQRVQVSPTRYRVPDICLLKRDQPRGPIATLPPLVCIEILSKDDTLRSMRERVKDYLAFGTEHVWILDAAEREAFVCTRGELNIPATGRLPVIGTDIFLPLKEIFSALD